MLASLWIKFYVIQAQIHELNFHWDYPTQGSPSGYGTSLQALSPGDWTPGYLCKTQQAPRLGGNKSIDPGNENQQ